IRNFFYCLLKIDNKKSLSHNLGRPSRSDFVQFELVEDIMNTFEFKDKLVLEISKCNKVKAIGQTGDMKEILVPGFSDIDLFVLCDKIPTKEERLKIYKTLKDNYSTLTMEVCNGGFWGYGDILISDDIEVMPMYFEIDEMEKYIDDTLKGYNIQKEGRFYPTGRLASVETINVLYEDDMTWTRLIRKVKQYPAPLFNKLYTYHISHVLNEEDLGRVLLRKDIVFYHQVLEEAIDQLLQALYAANYKYFPSRKRTKLYIDSMPKKPQDFYNRLLKIIESGSISKKIEESVMDLRNVTTDLKKLVHNDKF
ncbi:DUF4037 domain-containing protein, partial [[Clostridium] fimetarium]